MTYNTFCFSKNNTIEKVRLANYTKSIKHKICIDSFPCVLSREKKYNKTKQIDCYSLLNNNITECNGENEFLVVYDGKKINKLKTSEMLDFCNFIYCNNLYKPKKLVKNIYQHKVKKYIKTKITKEKNNNYTNFVVDQVGTLNVEQKINIQNLTKNECMHINVKEYVSVPNKECFENLQKCLKATNNTEYLNKTSFINKTINKENFMYCFPFFYNNVEAKKLALLMLDLY